MPSSATPHALRRKLVLGAAALPVLAGCAGAVTGGPPAAPRAEIAPTGTLRAVINYGNPVLANRDPQAQPAGLSVDLAREVARRIGVPVTFESVDSARFTVEALKAGRADIGFVAIDPARAGDMDYTAPYVIIEGAYMVPTDSAIERNEDVDRPGHRIVVGRGSAYDLYLTREIRQATLVRAPSSDLVVDYFLSQKMEVAAGVRQQLEADAQRVRRGVRLLPGRFMVIEQAMGLPKGRPAAQAWLGDFIEEMKASGFVADALRRHGIEGAGVAPPRVRR